MDKEVYIKLIKKMLEKTIMDIKEKYENLKTSEFKGPAILMMLGTDKLNDDDLYIDYYNKDIPEYKKIDTKIDALKYIKSKGIQYVTVAYSNKYITDKIVNDIKDYIVSSDINDSYKMIMIMIMKKFFDNNLKELLDEVQNCVDLLDYENDDEIEIIDDNLEDEDDYGIIDNVEYENDINTVEWVESLYNVENIESFVELETIDELKELLVIDDHGSHDDYKLDDFLDDEEYLSELIKYYYNKNYKDKTRIYLEPNADFTNNMETPNKDAYRKMLIDMFDKLSFFSNDLKDPLNIMIDIINRKVNINDNFYDAYVGEVNNYEKLFDTLKLVIISDYYKNCIINENILDDEDKIYLSYLKNDMMDAEIIKNLYEFEQDFSIKATLGFLDYNSFQDKCVPDKSEEKILEKIDPFKK